MNREIKFRGLQKDGKFAYGKLLSDSAIGRWGNSEIYNYSNVYLGTVGQFTGLLDKNGVEIYEGDIIQIDEYSSFEGTGKGIVDFLNGSFVCLYGQDAYGKDKLDNINTVNDSREVVGNIHQNPELLQS